MTKQLEHAYSRTYGGMWLASLCPESHAKTCGYWYTITTGGCTPHTAFRTRAALVQWLDLHGLTVDGEIPPLGTSGGLRITGEYRTALHRSYGEFYAQVGVRVRRMSNGEYTLAIISTDDDGLRTEHTLNPNCRERPKFPYRQSDRLIDIGAADTLEFEEA